MTNRLTKQEVTRAAEILRRGGTVAFPTETVYGLGANALDVRAVAKIFVAKDRPAWDPLIVHVSDEEMLARIAVVSPSARLLIEAFWPGPLTLLLPRLAVVPDAVTAGRALVGVRMPRHPLALELITLAGIPVAAPSANRFGRTSPTAAKHVLEDLDGRIDAVLDGGPTEVGVESTVFDVEARTIYRPGAVTAAMIEERLGSTVHIYRPEPTEATPESLPSPGVGIRHYAPRARLILVGTEAELHQTTHEQLRAGNRTGVMLPAGWEAPLGAIVFPWAGWKNSAALAHSVFAGLRQLDNDGAEVIICPLPPTAEGLGLALQDRLGKAARRS